MDRRTRWPRIQEPPWPGTRTRVAGGRTSVSAPLSLDRLRTVRRGSRTIPIDQKPNQILYNFVFNKMTCISPKRGVDVTVTWGSIKWNCQSLPLGRPWVRRSSAGGPAERTRRSPPRHPGTDPIRMRSLDERPWRRRPGPTVFVNRPGDLPSAVGSDAGPCRFPSERQLTIVEQVFKLVLRRRWAALDFGGTRDHTRGFDKLEVRRHDMSRGVHRPGPGV